MCLEDRGPYCGFLCKSLWVGKPSKPAKKATAVFIDLVEVVVVVVGDFVGAGDVAIVVGVQGGGRSQ